ncbi:MAG: hypothetical protein M3R10_03195, partial [Verrucomicrobiota bacterium]|nr:hypothetical protein [Verrucomicrobiota bacterium]
MKAAFGLRFLLEVVFGIKACLIPPSEQGNIILPFWKKILLSQFERFTTIAATSSGGGLSPLPFIAQFTTRLS